MYPEGDPERRPLQQIRENCMAMLKGVQRLIQDLRPPVLDDLGLESAVQWVLENRITSYNVCYTKLLRPHRRCPARWAEH